LENYKKRMAASRKKGKGPSAGGEKNRDQKGKEMNSKAESYCCLERGKERSLALQRKKRKFVESFWKERVYSEGEGGKDGTAGRKVITG